MTCGHGISYLMPCPQCEEIQFGESMATVVVPSGKKFTAHDRVGPALQAAAERIDRLTATEIVVLMRMHDAPPEVVRSYETLERWLMMQGVADGA